MMSGMGSGCVTYSRQATTQSSTSTTEIRSRTSTWLSFARVGCLTDDESFVAAHVPHEQDERDDFQVGSDRPAEVRGYQGGRSFREIGASSPTRGADTASLDTRGSEDSACQRTESVAEIEIQIGTRDQDGQLLEQTPPVIPDPPSATGDEAADATIALATAP